MDKVTARIKVFFSNRTNAILVGVLILILIGIGFGVTKVLSKPKPIVLQEVDLPFDPEGPYALLTPRRDGNALVLNITRVSSYDAISYELSYQSAPTDVKNSDAEEGSGSIDRGVQGTLDTKSKKGDYSQEILFGTCSQGYTTAGPHCTFDTGVENGNLILRIQKGNMVYKMQSNWHIQQPDIDLGVINSTDGHFSYKTAAGREELANISYTIVNDLSGAPKLPAGKQVLGKVYALNVPTAKVFPKGDVKIELSENPPADAKIARYDDAKNSWDVLDTKADKSTLSASANGGGVFAVLTAASSK